MLFSATMPGAIVSLARKYQNKPVHIRVNDPDEGLTKADIKQFVYRAHSLDKDNWRERWSLARSSVLGA
jgi:superfamily II DNA/RNA helicase